MLFRVVALAGELAPYPAGPVREQRFETPDQFPNLCGGIANFFQLSAKT
jgi:hypothetical protein